MKKKPFDFEAAEAMLDEIRRVAKTGDFEAAHSREDILWEETLKVVAKTLREERPGYPNIAEIALKSRRIKFTRARA